MIDLRSDTVTRPTPAMRQVIADAEVGDDVYHDDPTVIRLEERVAGLLGKDDAVYMPSGTMTNQAALRAHTEPGDVILAEARAHLALLEGGGPGALSGLTVRPLSGLLGVFTAETVRAAAPPPHPSMPGSIYQPVKLVCLENTHNVAGGTVWPLNAVREVTAEARDIGLRAHLDGARLWNASVATGVAEAAYAETVDTVSVCFSKGLGAPMGSALAGNRDLVERARRFKQMFGGGFRQAGLMAAGALYAVEHHRERLAEDHANAARFAEALENIPGVEVDRPSVQTNIVRFEVTSATSAAFVELCHEQGVRVLSTGPAQVRAVFNLNVSAEDTTKVIDIVAGVAGELALGL